MQPYRIFHVKEHYDPGVAYNCTEYSTAQVTIYFPLPSGNMRLSWPNNTISLQFAEDCLKDFC